MENTPPPEYGPRTNAFKTLMDKVYMHRLPSYGNKIFYGLGFLALTSLAMLVASGFILAFLGQQWWLHDPWGIYVRSVHLWSVQALIAILVLHGLVGFTTSGFRAPRRMVWVFGALMFCLLLFQTEFGYGLRGDFSSQFRATSGADFWNGSYLGWWINPLSHVQEYAIHIAIIPIIVFFLFVMHYLLERTYGIARPYRDDIPVRMVAADHTVMWLRGGALIIAILVLASIYRSPYVPAIRISDIAVQEPQALAATLMEEFDHTSDTSTYLDSIDPYTFDTRHVFVVGPYESLAAVSGANDAWREFKSASAAQQKKYIADAEVHFGDSSQSGGGSASVGTADAGIEASSTNEATGTGSVAPSLLAALPAATSSLDATVASTSATSTPDITAPMNPIVTMINTLYVAAESGAYESLLNDEDPAPHTYVLRFLSDMDALETKAGTLNFDTMQWGMAKDETGNIVRPTPGSWWFMPLAVLNTVFDLPDNKSGDLIAAEALGLFMLLMVTFPYIPYLNRLPELLHLAPIIWKDTHQPPQ